MGKSEANKRRAAVFFFDSEEFEVEVSSGKTFIPEDIVFIDDTTEELKVH